MGEFAADTHSAQTRFLSHVVVLMRERQQSLILKSTAPLHVMLGQPRKVVKSVRCVRHVVDIPLSQMAEDNFTHIYPLSYFCPGLLHVRVSFAALYGITWRKMFCAHIKLVSTLRAWLGMLAGISPLGFPS